MSTRSGYEPHGAQAPGASVRDGSGEVPRRRERMLSRDLRVVGLSAREAGRLRDALARAELPLDDDFDDGTVLVRPPRGRTVSTEQVLSVLRSWARRRGIARLPLVYGQTPYVLSIAPPDGSESAGGVRGDGGPREAARA